MLVLFCSVVRVGVGVELVLIVDVIVIIGLAQRI